MAIRRAFVTGVTGQDGSYLAEFLIEKGYHVAGMVRRSSSLNRDRIDHCHRTDDFNEPGLSLHYGDLADESSMTRLLLQCKPDEVYNLGAQSHVRVSFDQPVYSADIAGMGCLRLLEATRLLSEEKEVRFYQAGSSEMYGKVHEVPQRETTPFHPRSPYACGKVLGYYQTQNHRESWNLFACNGILFNHESPRRGETFVTRKITLAVGRIKEGLQDKLYLGNIDSKRDWGHAKDYVEAMWLMLQQDVADDYVIAMGETHSVREFLEAAFGAVGLDWQCYVAIDERFFRPAEVDILWGDPSKAKTRLGWKPKYTFKSLVSEMVMHDWELAKRQAPKQTIRRAA